MTERERLQEILNTPIFPHENIDPLEALTDFLLDSGVTCVVRCRDCVHRELRRNGYRCELNADPYAGPVVDGGDDEFCSYGERNGE